MADGDKLSALVELDLAGLEAIEASEGEPGIENLLFYVVDTTEVDEADRGKKVNGFELLKMLMRPVVSVFSGTARTIAESDDGRVILCTGGSPMTLTFPQTLPDGFSCTILRPTGASTVSIESSGTMELGDLDTAPDTSNTYAVTERGVATVIVSEDSTPTAYVYGDVS